MSSNGVIDWLNRSIASDIELNSYLCLRTVPRFDYDYPDYQVDDCFFQEMFCLTFHHTGRNFLNASMAQFEAERTARQEYMHQRGIHGKANLKALTEVTHEVK